MASPRRSAIAVLVFNRLLQVFGCVFRRNSTCFSPEFCFLRFINHIVSRLEPFCDIRAVAVKPTCARTNCVERLGERERKLLAMFALILEEIFDGRDIVFAREVDESCLK